MPSPKTANHEGHAVRPVPIAPDLRTILQRLFEDAEPGTQAAVPRLRDPSMNLRTTFGKIIEKAGVKPWPRLFHNVRASCATDWVERFPAHVVAGWLGHSPQIAARHYLQTRDAHFDMATGGANQESGATESQNPAQQPTAGACAGSPESSESHCFAGVSQAATNECEAAANEGNGRNRTANTPPLFPRKREFRAAVALLVAHLRRVPVLMCPAPHRSILT